LRRIPAILVVGFIAIQAVPYGRAHNNPPVLAEPQWDSTATRSLAAAACYDCHSNEVVWPWYTNIAPVSWLATRDVDEGRDKLNFSEWNRGDQETDELAEVIESGEMPPIYYGWMHPAARLTDAEIQQLIAGLAASVGDIRG
jgi:mono/diheme cytochrome c family protein